MPRNTNDLSPTEKVKVALDCLHRELLGDASASKTVAQKYDLSTRGVTILKNQALDILQKGFDLAKTGDSRIAPSVNDHTLDQALNSLLSPPPTKERQIEESKSEQEQTDGLTLDQVFSAISDYNKSKKEPPIYLSQGLIQKISGQPETEVKTWFAAHEQEVQKHNAKYELTPVTNRRIKRDFNFHQALGLA